MFTFHDFQSRVFVGASRYPDELTETEEGDSVDMRATQGTCFAILVVGVVTGTTPTMDVKLQESDDNSTWTDIPSGAFTRVSAAVNLQVLRFQRTKRYVRQYSTIAGTDPVFNFAFLLGGEREITGGNGSQT